MKKKHIWEELICCMNIAKETQKLIQTGAPISRLGKSFQWDVA